MTAVLVIIGFFAATFAFTLAAVAIASGVAERATPALLKDDQLSSISPWGRILERFDFVHLLGGRMAEADLDWSAGRACAMMLLAGTVAMVAFSHIDALPGVAVAVLSVAIGLSPYFYVLRVRHKRFAEFENTFPECLDSLVRAVRAGHPFAAGMEMLASESGPPVSTEMRKTLEEWKLGRSWDHALDNFAKRIPLVDVNIFAAAVKLQMRTGGRLGEVLGKLAESIRENAAIQGEVKAMAAHGKMSGLVLTLLPVFIAGMMLIVNPAQIALLWAHPTGRNLIAIAVMCVALAHFVIRRITDIRL